MSDERENIIRRLEEAAQNTPYPPAAFLFVLQAFPKNESPHLGKRHVSVEELCWLLHDQALEMFGPRARQVLAEWSIYSCEDFGKIVWQLAEAGLMSRSDDDSLDAFRSVFDFDEAFAIFARPRRTGRLFQWPLSTVFVLTTIVAVAFAGLSRAGPVGGVVTIFSAWFALIGAVCVAGGIRRAGDRFVPIALGVVLTTAGLAGFLAVVLSLLDRTWPPP